MANFEVKISASINLLFLKSDLGIRVQTPIITWDYEMNFNGEIKIFYYLFDTYYACFKNRDMMWGCHYTIFVILMRFHLMFHVLKLYKTLFCSFHSRAVVTCII